MKVLKFLSVLFILFSLFTFTSCVNEPLDPALLDSVDNGGGTDGGGTGGGGTGTGGGITTEFYIKVTKDGVVKKWTFINTLLSNDSFILVSNDGSTSMNLSIDDFTGVGNYNLDYISVTCNYVDTTGTLSSDYSDFTASSGKITITEFNETKKTIKGTFNFVGKNEENTISKTFSNGEFSVKYITP